jgi:very-short-patch-repair endonuclease
VSGPFDLSGRTALVTGSTRGLGLAMARALAAAGARVAINGRTPDACEAVLPEGGVAAPFDVTDESAVADGIAALGRVEAEVVLWTFLRRRALHGYKFRRQHPIGPYIADFACVSARLVIEVDGATHSTPEELAHDAKRTAFLEKAGWRILRVNNIDVFENMDGVWQTVAHRAR